MQRVNHPNVLRIHAMVDDIQYNDRRWFLLALEIASNRSIFDVICMFLRSK